MIKHQLKVALRSLLNYKFYTAINMAGLSIGITICLVIFMYVTHQYSYDNLHKNYDKIFKAVGTFNYGGMEIQAERLSIGFAPKAKGAIPEIKEHARLYIDDEGIISAETGKSFFENNIVFTEPSFFSVFDFTLLQGKPNALDEALVAFITPSVAKKYFGNESPVGKELTYNKEYILKIVGIVEEPPTNSSQSYSIIASLPSLGLIDETKNQYEFEKAGFGVFITYLLLDNPENQFLVENSLNNMMETSDNDKFVLTPLADLHLGAKTFDNPAYTNIIIFISIALIILILAIVNYVNLTTARATVRSKEVGIKKIVGARFINIFSQFYLESGITVLVASVISITMIYVLLPVINNFIQLNLGLEFMLSTGFIVSAAFIIFFSIVISGAYPSYIISKFQPAQIIKGNVTSGGKGNSWLQKSFSGFQFTISIALILCTIVVMTQLDFVRGHDVGLDKERVLIVELSPTEGAGYNYYKNSLQTIQGVEGVGSASTAMYKGGFSVYFVKHPETKEEVALTVFKIDESFPEILGLDWKSKSTELGLFDNLILNEKAADFYGGDGDPLGKSGGLGNPSKDIVGVVEDFNFSSLKSEIRPLAMVYTSDTSRAIVRDGASLYIKLSKGADPASVISEVKNLTGNFQPEAPFSYYFMDDAFDKMYKSEEQLASLFKVFTFLGVGLACLGLLGLITFALERRMREISIRKILGAGEWQIIQLMTKEYVWMFIISITVAVPVAWYLMEQWLTSFSYKIEIQVWMALLAILVTLVIAVPTIIFKSLASAKTNPAEVLRSNA